MRYSDYAESLQRATEARARGETWDDDRFRDAREQDLRQRTAEVRSAVIAALSCMLLAALLTSAKIVEIAERQELGPTRDRQVALAEGLDRVANFLSLNRPYDAIQDIRGTGESAAVRLDTIDEVVEDLGLETPATTIPPATTSSPVATATTAPPATTTSAPEARAPLRTVTGDEPLTVFVGGDSQAEYLGQAITTESDLAIDVEVQHEISTSLARPDYFNWPARLAEIDESLDPDAVVFFIGANDHQDMAGADGERLVEGSEEWRQEWARRLAVTFDLLERDGRHIFWVTQPPMRDGGLDAGIREINEIAASVIASRDFVTMLDIYDLFGGNGGFSERVTGPGGEELRARIDDGVHLTRSASSWVADLFFDEARQVWDFGPASSD